MKELPELIVTLNKKVRLTRVLDYFGIEYEESEVRFRVLCPFHKDHVPSLIIYTDNEDGCDTFWCPPCPRTGDSFELIRLMTRKRLGLALDDKNDFKESFEVLKGLANYKETKLSVKERIIEKFTKKAEETQTRDAHKKYYYMCGIETRDALKEGIITEAKADEIFKKMDEKLDDKNIEEAKKLYDKIREVLRKRRNK